MRRGPLGGWLTSSLSAAIVLGACGGGDDPIDLEARATTSPSQPTTTASAVSTTVVGTTLLPSSAPASTVDADPPAEWTSAVGNLEGLSSECGNVSYVSARPDRNAVIAGIALQGLWERRDGSRRWTRLGDDEGSATIINRASSIVYDPTNPDTFWESGIYNGGGVYRTVDDGRTFEQLGDVTHSDLVAVDFTDPERRTLLSGTHELPTPYRSADGGATWTDVSQGLPDGVGHAVAPLVIDAQTHLLGTKSGSAAGIYRTTDGGGTWERVHRRGISGPPLVTSSGIYWLSEGGGQLVSSNDDGRTWTELPAPSSVLATSLVALPDDRMVTLGDNTLIMSDDRGGTWRAIGPPLSFTPSGITYSSADKAFYVWYFTCDPTTDNPIARDQIMRLEFDPGSE